MRRNLVTLALCLIVGPLAARASDDASLLATCAAKTASASALARTDKDRDASNATSNVHQLIRMERLDDALAAAISAVNSDPEDARLQTLLGEVYYAQSKFALASGVLNRALQLDPCNARARYYAWRFNALAGRVPESQRELDLAHQIAPHDVQVQRTWSAVQLALRLESAPDAPSVTLLKVPLHGYFTKTLDCDGVPVRSSAAVDSEALVLACGRIRKVLLHLPKERKTLIARGAEFHVIGDLGKTTDLPENARFRNSAYIDAEGKSTDMDQRARGVGGLSSSCGEENLLHLPNDRYGDGFDTCTHEFSHDLMDNGFSRKEVDEIEKQYRASLAKGLWKGAYAAVNPKEYWAEISMWYFGTRGTYVVGGINTPGPDALRAYDPDAYALADRLYSGQK